MHAIRQIRHNRHFREPEMAVIPMIVAPDSVAVDVGANVGVYTSELSAAVGPRGKVYSFEPVAETFDILSALVRSARLANVSAFRMALGAQVGQCEMVVPDMDAFTGYYWAHLAQAGELGRREIVTISTLDEIYRSEKMTRVDFIKCDVEGCELDVVCGSQETVRRHKPAWLIEVSQKASDDIFRVLFGWGYRAYVLDGKLTETGRYRDKEFSNYFFLHAESALYERGVLAAAVLQDGKRE
jgi:FkbM family methyltransferase